MDETSPAFIASSIPKKKKGKPKKNPTDTDSDVPNMHEPPLTQVFQRLHYDRYKVQIKHEYAAYVKDLPEGTRPKILLAWCNARMLELLERETDEVKAEVMKAQEEGNNDDIIGLLSLAKLKNYDEVIELLACSVIVLLHQIWKKTGWIASITLGGPRPSNDGSLESFS
ncbi:hypothetical protein OF83DRAFT_1180146 [Amylostereum chailletii]|nr:hypothetical protein OF83DRAFT_1180146 [Amylostereum chailletii]